eukprot:scaffold205115_cov20-Tisochrysis_lutea.AAC.1
MRHQDWLAGEHDLHLIPCVCARTHAHTHHIHTHTARTHTHHTHTTYTHTQGAPQGLAGEHDPPHRHHFTAGVLLLCELHTRGGPSTGSWSLLVLHLSISDKQKIVLAGRLPRQPLCPFACPPASATHAATVGHAYSAAFAAAAAACCESCRRSTCPPCLGLEGKRLHL